MTGIARRGAGPPPTLTPSPQRLEYQANLLGLQAQLPVVTHIMHKNSLQYAIFSRLKN